MNVGQDLLNTTNNELHAAIDGQQSQVDKLKADLSGQNALITQMGAQFEKEIKELDFKNEILQAQFGSELDKQYKRLKVVLAIDLLLAIAIIYLFVR